MYHWLQNFELRENNRIITSNTIVPREKQLVEIFPNPASNSIQIKANKNTIINYQLFCAGGILIKQGQSESGILDISGMSSGIYVLKLGIGDNNLNRKIVIK